MTTKVEGQKQQQIRVGSALLQKMMLLRLSIIVATVGMALSSPYHLECA